MFDFLPWRPLQAVAWDVLQSALHHLPRPPPPPSSPPSGVPVFVMLPLDAALPNPTLPLPQFRAALQRLSQAGVRGVMADVWWGLCEPHPAHYDFDTYVELFGICKEEGLHVQATMSFHACGGNIGDSVNVPLPEWVGERSGFVDRSGVQNSEYISFGTDHEAILPVGGERKGEEEEGKEGGEKEKMRTPVEAYGAFVKAFVEVMEAAGLIGTTVTELQIGLGPCGELRYPSYPLAGGKWEFPGIGEFQCYDKYLRADLAEAVRTRGSEVVRKATLPPDDTGNYNDRPWDTRFFMRGFRTAAGRFFLQWYSDRMVRHADDVLREIRRVLPESGKDVALAVKVSGVHWWKLSPSRAAEATAGYISGPGETAYAAIARVLQAHEVVLDFTCLEMRTVDQPFLKARCGPRQLVAEVFRVAQEEGVAVAGENALERYDWGAFMQIANAFQRCGTRKYGFTLLRLGEGMLKEESMQRIERFVNIMNKI